MLYWNTLRRETYQNSRVQTPGDYDEITLATFKQWLKWDPADTSEDAIMTSVLKGAIQAAEMYTRRVISLSTWRTYLDGFNDITFDVLPVSSVVVKYFTDSSTTATLATTEYEITDNGPDDYGSIRFTWNTLGSAPEPYDKSENVYLEYQAGYSTIPDGLVGPILRQATDYFENRANIITGSYSSMIGFSFHPTLFPYKLL